MAQRLAAISPRFGAAVANEVRACAYWPVPATETTDPVHAPGAPPIVVIGNRGDVATPYASAQKVAGMLEHGVLITYDGEGHTSYTKSPCVDAAVDAYLTDATVPAAGLECH
jgi:hypothetical protein